MGALVIDVAAGERTLFPANAQTRRALTPLPEDTLGRVLVRLDDPVLVDAWTIAHDDITGRRVAIRKADCGAGCRCAGEVVVL